ATAISLALPCGRPVHQRVDTSCVKPIGIREGAMHRHTGAESNALNGVALDLDGLRSEALSYLTITLAGLAWGLNLIMPIMTSNADTAEQFFLDSLALIAIAVCGGIVLRYSVTLAGTLVAGATT